MTLPTPYSKEAQPFEHFDHPEDLARARVQREIKNGTAYQRHELSTSCWYGHGTQINGDKLTVKQCGGVEMNIVFDYQKLLQEALTPTLL